MNNNTLGDALKKALDSRKPQQTPFIWKGEKKKEGDGYVQTTEIIDEMTPERLKSCYEHCKRMLYNDNPKHLGRYNVLEEIADQIDKCNVELFLRYCDNTYLRREGVTATPKFKMMRNIRTFIKNSENDVDGKDIDFDWDNIPITHLTADLPAEFVDISISEALEGSIDNLGIFDKQHLTMTFITKMGIWFNKAEENELKGISNVERLKIIRERLHIPDELNLKLSEKGLSYHEMRAMLILPKKQRYSDMTTEQLVTLRNKVLPRLQKEVDGHVFSWNRLKKQIEIVARRKGINLND